MLLPTLDRNCTEIVLLYALRNSEDDVLPIVEAIVFPYPEKPIEIIYSSSGDPRENLEFAKVEREMYDFLDKSFVDVCRPCYRRLLRLCPGDQATLLNCDLPTAGEKVHIKVGELRARQNQMRERIYTEEMVLPPFFIIKGLTSEFSREGTVSVGDKSYLTPSYHLAKSSIYDGGFEAIHATNIYSGADSTEEGKVCLGSDIALLLYREHRDLVGPFEGLLSAEKFFHIFFTSSQKNLDLHANPAFHYSFGFSDFVSDDEDDEDEGNDVGSLRPRIFEEGTYNPAWFWRNAIEHWDTSMYTDHVSDLPTFRSYVSDETTFCINTAQHCVYLFLEDETIPPFENILFQGRVGSEIGCILVVVKK